MNDLEKEYAKILERREKIQKELKELEEMEIIKRYFRLRLEWDISYNKKHDLYKQIENEKLKSCRHILVNTSLGGKNRYQNCGCIKCGVDTSILEKERSKLNFEDKIKYDYLKENYIRLNATHIGVVCDLNLAMAIYFKIKEYHPGINDETAIYYLKVALNDIRNIKVNYERKESRAKRLSLKPTFDRWNENDIRN